MVRYMDDGIHGGYMIGDRDRTHGWDPRIDGWTGYMDREHGLDTWIGCMGYDTRATWIESRIGCIVSVCN